MNTLPAQLKRIASGGKAGITFIEGARQETFLSYAHLYEQALGTLHQLQRRGLKAGSQVLFQIEHNEPFLRVFWACLLGGILPVPLSIGQQAAQKRKLLKLWHDLPDAYLLSDEVNAQRVRAAAAQYGDPLPADGRSLLLRDVLVQEGPGQPHDVQPDDIAYVQYSSGSTGAPKGVVLTHRNLLSNTGAIRNRSGITGRDAALSWMPLTHDMGLICFHLSSLLAGIPQYIMPTALFIRRPVLWLEQASRHGITHLYSPNFGFQYFLAALSPADAAGWDLSRVRLIYNGAELISAQVCQHFTDTLRPYGLSPAAMYPGYGLAEASVAVTLPAAGRGVVQHWLDRNHLAVGKTVRDVEKSEIPKSIGFVEVGHPVPECEVRICDGAGAVLPSDVVGNVQVRGNNVTSGYLGNAAATREAFTADGWLHTQDLGFFRNGNLVIVGRAKNLIIINGQNYYPHDIERAALGLPGVEPGKIVACSARKDGRTDQVLVFILWKKPLPEFESLAQCVREAVYRQLGLAVDHVIPVRQIPKTTSGKIQHFHLVEQYLAGAFDETIGRVESLNAPEAPFAADFKRLSGSEKLQLIWYGITGERLAGDEAGLFAEGMNSLRAARFRARITDLCGVELTLRDLFENPTVGALGKLLDARPDGTHCPVTPVAPQPDYPLSKMQKRFWLIEGYRPDPGVGVCNITVAARLRGEVHPGALAEAWQCLVDRHESLRTAFAQTGEEPRQAIRAAGTATAPFHYADWRNETDPEGALSALLGREARRPFNLQSPPLARLTLVRTGAAEWGLVLSMHHLVADGWSVHVLTRELGAFYRARREGTPAPLPPLPVQFKEYLAWRDRQAGAGGEGHRAYWTDALSGELTAFEWVRGRQRPALPAFAGRTVRFDVPPAVAASLRSLGRRLSASPFQTLFAAVNALLYQYTGQTDIVLGTDAAGRVRTEFEQQIGLYINTLPLRTRFTGDASFAELLATVKTATLAAFDHQLYESDNLVEDLRLTRDMSRTPLFDMLVLYQNFDQGALFEDFAPGLSAEMMPVDPEISLVDMQWEFVEAGDGLTLNLLYNTALFAPSFVERLGRHFVRLLEVITGHAFVPLRKLDLLAPGEKEQLLALGHAPGPSSNAETTLVALFETQAAATPGAVALRCGGRGLTYAELNGRANQLAHYLRETAGVQPGHLVGLAAARNEQLLVSLLAILKAGGAFLPVDPALPAEQARVRIGSGAVQAIVTDGTCAFAAESTTAVVVMPERLSGQLAGYPSGNPAPVTGPADLAYVLYTSGSTGAPKGVMIEHRSAADYAQTFARCFALTAADRVIQQASLSFDTAIEEIFPVWSAGGRLVVVPGGGGDVEALLDAVAGEGATVLSTTPLVISELNRQPGRLKSLRLLISGGDALQPAYVDRLVGNVPLYNTYGPTESTVCATYHRVERPEEVTLIGRPFPNRELFVLAPDGLGWLPAGVPGEICIGGTGLARGYLHNAGLTAEKFVPHPCRPGDKVYRTGDLGRWTEAGTLEFLGRTDHQVKIRGYRIETAEVEKVLLTHPAVAGAVVTPWTDPGGEKQLVGYWVGLSPLSRDVLRQYLTERLPAYMVPTHLVELPGLPLTPSGKLNRKALPDPGSSDRPYLPPGTPLERVLCRIWAEVLEREPVGLLDNFFELGGHSLKGARIIARVFRELEVKLDLRELFAHPTVGALAGVVARSGRTACASIPALADRPWYDVSPAQRRIWLISQLPQASVAYNMLQAFRLTGAFDGHAFHAALAALVQRHESLRTTFAFVNGEPRQRIVSEAAPHVEYLDLRDAGDPARRAAELIEAALLTPFDLEAGPVFRTRIARLPGDERLLLFDIHHIAADGWSTGILTREFLALYAAYQSGREPGLPPVRLRYRDFAAWANDTTRGSAAAAQKEFWLSRFRAGIPVLHFPFDVVPAGPPAFRGNTLAFTCPPHLTGPLKAYGQTHGLTLNGTLFALYAVLLHKLSGQHHFIVGTLAAGREHPEVEQTVGMFANFLPVCCEVAPQATLAGHVRATQRELTEVYAHQAYPLEALMEELNVAHRALYNTMLIFHNEEALTDRTLDEQLAGSGLCMTPLPVKRNTAKLDCKLDLAEHPGTGELLGYFEYNTALLRAETAARIVGQFRHLLETFARDPETVIGHLSLPEAGPPPAPPLRVKISATFTAEPMAGALQAWGETFGLRFVPEFSPYNQVVQQFLPASPVAPPDVHLVLIRFEDWLRAVPPEDEPMAHDALDGYEQLLPAVFSGGHSARTQYLAGLFPPAPLPGFPDSVRNRLQRIRETWRERLATLRVPCLDFSGLQQAYRLPRVYEPEQDRLGHLPFTEAFYAALGTAVARKLRAWKQPPMKVIVLDADNTLWGGVCGEGEPLSVRVDEPYAFLQRFFLQKRAEGFLLALCSKNNEADVWEVFGAHPDMLLRREHLAAWRIGWGPKSEAIRSLARELNLDPDAFVFLDDSPVECCEVAAHCPGVLALQLPADPRQIPHYLAHLWALDKFEVTREDAQRNDLYRAEKQRQALLEGESLPPEAFLRTLRIRVSLHPCDGTHYARIAQLTYRTNQFNTSTIRRDAREIAAFATAAGNHCWAVQVDDRFGRYGISGAVLATERGDGLYLDTFLLSCRVLGRGVEGAVLSGLGQWCANRGLTHLVLHFRPTSRNQPAADALRAGGWCLTGQTGDALRYELAVAAIATSPVPCQAEEQALPEAAENEPPPGSEKPARGENARTAPGAGFGFDHLGIAVRALEPAVRYWTGLGYACGPVVHDPLQEAFLVMCRHPLRLPVELIAPQDERSTLNALLRRNGDVPYHLCYRVEGFDEALQWFTNRGIDFSVVSPAKPAPLFDGSPVMFLEVQGVGIIELLAGAPGAVALPEPGVPAAGLQLTVPDIEPAVRFFRSLGYWEAGSGEDAAPAALPLAHPAHPPLRVRAQAPATGSPGIAPAPPPFSYQLILPSGDAPDAARAAAEAAYAPGFVLPDRAGEPQDSTPFPLPVAPEALSPLHRAFYRVLQCADAAGLETRAVRPDGLPSGPGRAAPADPYEEILLRLWEEVLHREGVGVLDDFFALGGNSIWAIRVLVRIQRAFLIELTLKDFFEHPTIRQQAHLLRRSRAGESPAIPALASMPLYAASHAQQRLWTLHHAEADGVAYNLNALFTLHGDLSPEALRAVLRALTDRHESLRTTFLLREGAVVQQVHPPGPEWLSLLAYDWRGEPGREARLEALVERETLRPFDLQAGPLMRFCLVRVEEAASVLLSVGHHIICDEWSMAVLLDEFCRLYAATLAGRPSPLPALRVQYKDYAAWQKDQLRGAAGEAARQYWLAQFADEAPPLDFSWTGKQASGPAHAGASLSLAVEAARWQALQQTGAARDCTPFMALLATVHALLFRYTGRTDFTLGSSVAEREHPDLEKQVGLYLNQLALRVQFEAGDDFFALLERVKATTLGGFAHKFYPLDLVQENLNRLVAGNRPPLFAVMVDLQKPDTGPLPAAAGLRLGVLPARQVVSRHPLTFSFREAAGGLHVQITYHPGLFDASLVAEMAGGLRELIGWGAEQPHLPLAGVAESLTRQQQAQQQQQKRDFLARNYSKLMGYAEPKSP